MISRDSKAAAEPPAHRIPPPTGRRQPLKVNIFEKMQFANTQLMPLFPYYGEGAIIPCGATFRGEPGVEFGHFFHYNTVDEIGIVFGSHNSLVPTGMVHSLPRVHGVNSFLKDPADANSYLLIAITQRQSEGTGQAEAVARRCVKCHEQLARYEYDVTPKPQPSEGAGEDLLEPFPTLQGSMDAAEAFNADEALRTCPKCGHVNPPFDQDPWGWVKYLRQNWTVNQARRALEELAATARREDETR